MLGLNAIEGFPIIVLVVDIVSVFLFVAFFHSLIVDCADSYEYLRFVLCISLFVWVQFLMPEIFHLRQPSSLRSRISRCVLLEFCLSLSLTFIGFCYSHVCIGVLCCILFNMALFVSIKSIVVFKVGWFCMFC